MLAGTPAIAAAANAEDIGGPWGNAGGQGAAGHVGSLNCKGDREAPRALSGSTAGRRCSAHRSPNDVLYRRAPLALDMLDAGAKGSTRTRLPACGPAAVEPGGHRRAPRSDDAFADRKQAKVRTIPYTSLAASVAGKCSDKLATATGADHAVHLYFARQATERPHDAINARVGPDTNKLIPKSCSTGIRSIRSTPTDGPYQRDLPRRPTGKDISFLFPAIRVHPSTTALRRSCTVPGAHDEHRRLTSVRSAMRPAGRAQCRLTQGPANWRRRAPSRQSGRGFVQRADADQLGVLTER